MLRPIDRWEEQLRDDGFVLLPGLFAPARVNAILCDLTAALSRPAEGKALICSEAGSVTAARNVLTLWPPAATVWRQPPLLDALAGVLGPDFGLVRVLFFDKPPACSWSLPAHKDLTVAVRDNRLPSRHFRNPTRKAGVPHVEAPRELLDAMLTARIHLDEITAENGPLKVIPGSHRLGKTMSNGAVVSQPVLAQPGDVLLIRPLVEHSSAGADSSTQRHRRILHLEFAASPDLPDGYAWHDFLPGRAPAA